MTFFASTGNEERIMRLHNRCYFLWLRLGGAQLNLKQIIKKVNSWNSPMYLRPIGGDPAQIMDCHNTDPVYKRLVINSRLNGTIIAQYKV